MKSADIEAILDANPNARFARVPSDMDTQVRYLTDMVYVGDGCWEALTDGKPGLRSVFARVICPAEEAEAKVAATIERNAKTYARNRRAEQVAADLTRAGVPARASAGRIVVDSEYVEELANLLLCLGGE